MKKRMVLFTMLLAIVYSLCVTGCKTDVEHTDPAFLVGTWKKTSGGLGREFTIAGDYTFVCDLVLAEATDEKSIEKARVTGNMDYSGSDLGPNDYILKNLVSPVNGEPNEEYTQNDTVRNALGGYDGLIGTLTPQNDNMEFVFSAANPIANNFFGGTYTKQP